MDAGLLVRVHANLSAFPRLASESGHRRAAVAITLLHGPGGEAAFPLFLRSLRLGRHAGQMGLPGGRLEPGEDAAAAALRELAEELGVNAGDCEVLGLLDDFETRSEFVITPVVACCRAPAESLRPEPDGEIAQLYVVPLTELEVAAAAAAAGTSDQFSLRFSFGRMFAPTAALLFQFREVALWGRPTRVGDFYQPPFTWR